MSSAFTIAARAAAALVLLACGAEADEMASPPAQEAPSAQAPIEAAPRVSLTGQEIIERVSARPSPDSIHETIIMTITDQSGSARTRRATFLSQKFGDTTKTLIFFEEPTNLKGTGFLTSDFKAPDQADDQWLFLPSMGRQRRISASERGAYFLGTDFTYEDIKRQTKPSIDEFNYVAAGEEVIEGKPCLMVEATPLSDALAKDIGYGKVRVAVDPVTWMVVRTDYWDVGLASLKTTWLLDVSEVKGFLTPGRIVAVNHKTGSRTEFQFEDIDYSEIIGDDLFTEQTLRKGL